MAGRSRSAGTSSASEGAVEGAPGASPRRRYFLTGATGFIGSRLARRLLGRGERVRIWARPGSRTEALERLGAEVVRGDLLDVEGLTGALAAADVACHLAAIYDVGVVDAAALERTNVGGTRAFLDAVERAGTPRALYVSTSVALGPVAVGAGDESTRHGPHYYSTYERTKTEAHRLAQAAQARGLPLIIVCPANVYGPGDQGPNGRYIRDLLRGRVPGLPRDPAWFSYVHVDDVVEGLLLAADRAPLGSTYVLSGEDRSLNDFTQEVARLAGVRPLRLRFPAALVRITGTLADAISRLTGWKLAVTRENADTAAGHRWLHSHERATRELGWEPRSLAEGLPETIAWFRRETGASRRADAGAGGRPPGGG